MKRSMLFFVLLNIFVAFMLFIGSGLTSPLMNDTAYTVSQYRLLLAFLGWYLMLSCIYLVGVEEWA